MAYMSQEHKAEIAAKLKELIPKDWKYSLRVEHHSKLICTVSQAPINLATDVNWYSRTPGTDYRLNTHRWEDAVRDPALRELVGKIVAALNSGNYNNSDPMTDYFDVGHYVDLQFGKWNKPFVSTKKAA